MTAMLVNADMDELLAGPYHQRPFLRLAPDALRLVPLLAAATGELPVDVVRRLIAEDLASITDLRDQRLSLYLPHVVTRASDDVELRVNDLMHRLLQERVRALHVTLSGYMTALVLRAGVGLSATVDD